MDAEYDTGGDSFGSIFGDLLEGLGREVGGEGSGAVGKARKAGAYVLEELLDFLEGSGGGRSPGAGAPGDDGSRPAEELSAAREELAALRQLEETLQQELATWTQKAELAQKAGNADEELQAMRKVFDGRERRSNIRRRALRAEERVEYLEKVLFEFESKQKRKRQQADVPGMYTITHDRTKVASSEELSTTWVAELAKGASVRVVEVVRREKDKRVRARLDSPAGWISLLNTESGYRWAERVGPSERAGAGPGTGTAASTPAPAPRPAFDADAALAELKRKRAGA